MRLVETVILFDLGSTLLYFDAEPADVYPQMNHALARSLIRQGIALDAESFIEELSIRTLAAEKIGEQDWIEIPTFDVLRDLLVDCGYPGAADEVICQALAEYYAISQAHWLLEADAIPTLEQLGHSGMHLGIITNDSDAADAYRLLEMHQLKRFFEGIWISAEIGFCKPHPLLFQKALEFFKVPACQAVMVGDRLDTDIRGAQNAGLHSAWISRRSSQLTNKALQMKYVPDVKIASLLELPDRLAEFLF